MAKKQLRYSATALERTAPQPEPAPAHNPKNPTVSTVAPETKLKTPPETELKAAPLSEQTERLDPKALTVPLFPLVFRLWELERIRDRTWWQAHLDAFFEWLRPSPPPYKSQQWLEIEAVAAKALINAHGLDVCSLDLDAKLRREHEQDLEKLEQTRKHITQARATFYQLLDTYQALNATNDEHYLASKSWMGEA
jgi:hypothetical protein